MAELNELYQQVILDHNKKPRNFKRLETANREQEGYQPSLRRSDHALPGDGRRLNQRRGLPGIRLRDLEGLGLDDDHGSQRQDQGRSRK